MYKLSLHGIGCRALLLTSLSVSVAAPAMSQEQQYREISGSVRDQHGKPLDKAVVQIENQDSHYVETYIADADGAFHFKRVLNGTDYRIWAAFQGKESKKEFLSKFNDKTTLTMRLVIDL